MDFDARNMIACIWKTRYGLRPFFNIVEICGSCDEPELLWGHLNALYFRLCCFLCLKKGFRYDIFEIFWGWTTFVSTGVFYIKM